MSDRVFTEAEVKTAVDTAVAEATASMQSKLAELESNQAVEAAVAQAKTELEALNLELQTKLDAAVLDAAQAKEAKEAVEKAWADEKAAETAATELAARRDERLAKVREVACFPESYLEENADRFAALAEDEFSARVEEWKAIAKREEIPAKTAFTAARVEPKTGESSLATLREFRVQNIDPRTL